MSSRGSSSAALRCPTEGAGLPDLSPFPAFNALTSCPKCQLTGWFPRLNAQWHPEVPDYPVQRDCPALEHLHAACPCCGYSTFYAPADRASDRLAQLAGAWTA